MPCKICKQSYTNQPTNYCFNLKPQTNFICIRQLIETKSAAHMFSDRYRVTRALDLRRSIDFE